MPNRSVVVELRAQVSSFVAGMKQAQQATANFSSKASKYLQNHSAELNDLGNKSALLGAGMALLAGRAVKGFASFDRQMSAVAATGDDARQSLDGLRKTALQAGADTQFSAEEAAAGITNLIKAGRSARDVIGGDLVGTLDLAAAGELEVARAAEIAANTMNQFGGEAGSVTHIADLLVSGANAASGEVTDMADALNNVGGVVHQMGYSLEETIGFLTQMAYSGQVGAEAGTRFKSMLMALQAPSSKATSMMDELNLSLYDSAGKTKSLTQFVSEYRAALDGKTQAEKDSYNATIFGSYGIQAANSAYQQAGGTLQDWIDKVNQQGAAQRQAAILTDNWAGDIERLGGSFDTVFIKSGSGANNVLRTMTQSANVLVDAVGELPGPLLTTLATLVGSGGLTVAGVGGLLKLTAAAADAKRNFEALGKAGKIAKLSVGGVGAAIAIGTLALSAWADAQAKAKEQADEFASTLVVVNGIATTTDATLKSFNEGLTDETAGFGPWSTKITELMSRMGISVKDAQDAYLGQEDAVARVSAAAHEYWRTVESKLSPAQIALTGGSADVVRWIDNERKTLDLSKSSTEEKAAADKDAGVAATSYADAVSQSKAAIEGNTEATTANANAVDQWIKKQWEGAEAALALSGSQVGFERMLDTTRVAMKKLVKETKDKTDLTNLDTKAGQDAMDILNQTTAGTLARVKTMQKEEESESAITAEMERGRQALVAQARQAGFTEAAIADLASKYDLLPENVTTTVGENGASEADIRVNNLLESIKKLPKDQRAEIRTIFNDQGLVAAESALAKIDKTTANPEIKTTLDDAAIKKAREELAKLRDKTINILIRQGRIQADGGMWEHFAAGGARDLSQLRSFQGDAGVTWGERGSGPWEAFISGAPQNHDRSLAIWSEVGRRLGADSEDRGFAQGAVIHRNEAPSYMTSGAVITNNYIHNTTTEPAGAGSGVVIHMIVNNPVAENLATTINKGLQAKAAAGLIGGS